MSDASSNSSSCADGAGPASETPSRFIQLPAELRLKIYRYLYWLKGDAACGGVFAPTLHSWRDPDKSLLPAHAYRSRRNRWQTHELTTVAILMRVCKLVYFEVRSIIYHRTFGFFDRRPSKHFPTIRDRMALRLEFHRLFLFDGGPARHLRCVRVRISEARFLYPRSRDDWLPTTTWSDDPLIAPEMLLWSLARNATNLETLDLDFAWSLGRTIAGLLSHRDVGEEIIVRLERGFSWANSLVNLESLAQIDNSGFGASNGVAPPREEILLQLLSEVFAPADKSLQDAIRDGVLAAEGGPIFLAERVRECLYHVECAKLFWGVRILGILKGFSPTLRTVRLALTDDKKWTAKMENCLGLEVTSLPPRMPRKKRAKRVQIHG